MIDLIVPDAKAVLWQEQGTDLWRFYRACYVTASNFGTILGKNPHRSYEAFCEDIQNALLGNVEETEKQKKEKVRARKNIQWGRDHEKDGTAEYAIRYGLFVAENGEHVRPPHERTIYFPGLVVDKGNKLACSPDGLVGTEGAIEVKCPVSRRFYREIPEHYIMQCMGVMGICNRKWCDFIQWTPTGIRVDRIMFDPEKWENMKVDLETFYDNHADHYACCNAALSDYLVSFLTCKEDLHDDDHDDERNHAVGGACVVDGRHRCPHEEVDRPLHAGGEGQGR